MLFRSIAGSADPNSGYIGEDAAKAAARDHAGLAETDLQAIRVKLEYEDLPHGYRKDYLQSGC